MSEKFGFVVLTYPKDFYLAQVLIKSLEHFNPDIPITILPGTGFNLQDHPFKNYTIFVPDKKKWELFSDWDRKLILLADAPYEYFLYLDADILCLKDVRPLFENISKDIDARSLYVNLPWPGYDLSEGTESRDDRASRIKNGQIGNLDAISLFSPGYANDIYNHYPFNSGLWATKAGVFSHQELMEYKRREINFFKDILHYPYDCKNTKLFYMDQGKLNYLTWEKKVSVKSLYPWGHYKWGGDPFEITKEAVLAGQSPIPFVHWAGGPKPSVSLFRKAPLFLLYAFQYSGLGYHASLTDSVPAISIWLHFNRLVDYQESFWGPTFKDFYHVPYGIIKRLLKAAVSRLKIRRSGLMHKI